MLLRLVHGKPVAIYNVTQLLEALCSTFYYAWYPLATWGFARHVQLRAFQYRHVGRRLPHLPDHESRPYQITRPYARARSTRSQQRLQCCLICTHAFGLRDQKVRPDCYDEVEASVDEVGAVSVGTSVVQHHWRRSCDSEVENPLRCGR